MDKYLDFFMVFSEKLWYSRLVNDSMPLIILFLWSKSK